MTHLIDPLYVNYAATILTLAVLEGMLSADNALVLAVMVKHLPKEQRGKALRYGILGAFVFRAIGVLLAVYLIRFWYLKAAGAAYLLYLCVQHFWKKHRSSLLGLEAYHAKAHGFWKTVALVELTDVAFSVDSIVAAVALSDNKWIIYLGGILGIIAMRYVAQYFLKLLDTYTALESSAYLLVGWIGLKLALETYGQQTHLAAVEAARAAGEEYHTGMPAWLFWSVMAVLFFGAFLFKNRQKAEGLHHVLEDSAVAPQDGAPKEEAKDTPGSAS